MLFKWVTVSLQGKSREILFAKKNTILSYGTFCGYLSSVHER